MFNVDIFPFVFTINFAFAFDQMCVAKKIEILLFVKSNKVHLKGTSQFP